MELLHGVFLILEWMFLVAAWFFFAETRVKLERAIELLATQEVKTLFGRTVYLQAIIQHVTTCNIILGLIFVDVLLIILTSVRLEELVP